MKTMSVIIYIFTDPYLFIESLCGFSFIRSLLIFNLILIFVIGNDYIEKNIFNLIIF